MLLNLLLLPVHNPTHYSNLTKSESEVILCMYTSIAYVRLAMKTKDAFPQVETHS